MLHVDSSHAYVRAGDHSVALDCFGKHAFLSHAHLDHYRSLKKSEVVLSSPQTLDLLKARGKTVPAASVQSHELSGVRFSLPDAGHVLGSRMLYAEGEQTLLYTGDFLSEDSLTQKAARPQACDVLITECTYGSPEYAFPDRFAVYEQISRWTGQQLAAGRIAVIGAYSLGKAQEVIAALNQSGIRPSVSPTIAAINEVYVKNGVKLDYACNEADALKGAFAAVVPMHQVGPLLAQGLRHAYGRRAALSVATGWALSGRYAGVDQAFPLSDHNDFPGLLRFIEQCAPKKVYTTHGPAETFAGELRKRGFDAQPLDEKPEAQKTLAALC